MQPTHSEHPCRRTRALATIAATCVVIAAACGGLSGCGGSRSAHAQRRSSGAESTTPARAGSTSGTVNVRVGVGPRGGVVVVAPVFINGSGPFTFVVDTGASKSIIDQQLARKLGFSIRPSRSTLTGVNASHAAGRIFVSHWRIGDVSLPAQQVLTLPLASDTRAPRLGGLIGSDNLRRFGSFLLNYGNSKLVLNPR